MKYILYTFIGLFLPISIWAQENPSDTIILNQVDGPYIFHTDEGLKFIRVSENGIESNQYSKSEGNRHFWVSSQSREYEFEVQLKDSITRPEWNYTQTDSTFVMSDPHGRIEPFVCLLQAHKIISEDLSWSFGTNRLVLIGDIFDRGDDAVAIYWLVYKLENEAKAAGGSLHYLLGNHEEMILRNDVRYANEKYENLAIKLGEPQSRMWENDSEMGRWIRTRNTMEIIGNNLFVHAGLSKEFLEQEWTISAVNDTISQYLGVPRKELDKLSSDASFLLRSNGPLWYRGMVRTDEKYNPIENEYVDELLEYYNVNRIFVGHTIFEEVSSFYNAKVIDVNVSNHKNMEAGRSRAAIITPEGIFKLYDDVQRKDEIASE